MNAARFKAILGGDYPVGDESQRRKTIALRSTGDEAHFLTLIEPYADKQILRSASAAGPGKLCMELADGRVHEITIQNLEGRKDITAHNTETIDGKVFRCETRRWQRMMFIPQ